MLTLVCPCCGFVSPIEVFANDLAARVFGQLMGQVPPALSDDVLRYISLFAPAKHKVPFPRATRHLKPLVEAITAGRIELNQREWAAPVSAWSDGFAQMEAQRSQLVLPIRSHVYLFKIVAGQADKVEAQAEAQVEQQRRGGAPTSPLLPSDPEEARRIRAQAELVQQRATQARLKLPPLTADQEAKILAKFGVAAS